MSRVLCDVLKEDFEQDFTGTRRVLEAVPEAQMDWKPHQKSMTLGRLASHVAEIPSWGVNALQLDSLDIQPPGEPLPEAADFRTQREVLELFDEKSKALLEELAKADDAKLAQIWKLERGGQTMFAVPRSYVLRQFVLHHSIHHRAQLGVYLRMHDVALPAVLGPTADDAEMF